MSYGCAFPAVVQNAEEFRAPKVPFQPVNLIDLTGEQQVFEEKVCTVCFDADVDSGFRHGTIDHWLLCGLCMFLWIESKGRSCVTCTSCRTKADEILHR